ncbi:unnamed protein product [Ilex paraguariensis]|uniref:Uncharacterized protein n=1 Tax=Ilex paraguariensis TaxID=185542 RepID=A0ABC8TK18_9AQUA
MLPNQRPHLFDGRQLDSHPPGSLERGPFGQLPGNESNMRRINGAPGLESLRDERFNSVTDERLNAFAMEPTRRFDQGEFEDLRKFPRPPHLETEHAPNLAN